MTANRPDPRKRRSARGDLWLTLLVHFDAARLAPRAWFTALRWRLEGKRVRARAQFAPLLAASPRAYRLWLRDEPKLAVHSADPRPIIVVIVSAGEGQASTLRSLAEQGLQVLPLGTAQTPTLAAAAGCIDWSTDPWVMPLSAGDILAPGAADAYAAAVAGTAGRIVYADDDILDGEDRRIAPHFKPTWNPELFRHFDYLSGSCVLRASPSELAGASGPDWVSGLIAAVAGTAGAGSEPVRLPHVLHHRRSRPTPRVPIAIASGHGALPKVTVIVPTRNRLDLLRTCIEGLERTDYPTLEVIVVDNGSDDPATLAWLAARDPARCRVLRHPGPFNFSILNNRAAARASGEVLCLLNNDIEIVSPDWLRTMVPQSLRSDVGAVGAQLLYPDGRIQHAGVVLGICGGAAHAHRLLCPEDEGYFRRHALPQFVSAVTAACMVVRRDRFEAVGGLDEQAFAVAFNDVDLCMRLNSRGWQSLYEPRAKLIHHESVSRGLDRDPAGAARFAGELAALKRHWGTDVLVDPFHHPQLDRFSERFVVRV